MGNTRVDDVDTGFDPAYLGSFAGSALGDAIDTAVAAAGSGAARGVQLEDDAEAYRIDVITSDGRTQEVTLDVDFNVIGTEFED